MLVAGCGRVAGEGEGVGGEGGGDEGHGGRERQGGGHPQTAWAGSQL